MEWTCGYWSEKPNTNTVNKLSTGSEEKNCRQFQNNSRTAEPMKKKKKSRTAEVLSSLMDDEIKACKSSKRKLKNNDCNRLLATDGECL